MNFKKIITLCFLGVSMLANAEITHVTVELKEGGKYSFLLAEKPVITFKGADLVVNDNAATSYALSDVKNYHFTESDETKVEAVANAEIRIVNLNEQTIEVQNSEASVKVNLIAANSAVLSTTTTDANGKATINLPQTKGVYIVTVGNKSFKVIRK